MNFIKYAIFLFISLFIISTVFQVISEYGWVLVVFLFAYLSYVGIKNFLKDDNNDAQSQLVLYQNELNANGNTIKALKNENSSLRNQNNYLKQQLENQKQNHQQKENELPFQNIVKIPNRRPFEFESFQLEKDIDLILSDKEDKKGKTLVKLIIKMIQKMGYYAVNNDGYKDKGQDILVYKNKNDKKPFIAIQCKSYSPQKNKHRTTAEEVSTFNGHVANNFEKHNRIFITSSYFEKSAIQDDLVTLIDRVGLINLFLQYFPKETVNVLNSNTLYKIEDVCKICEHGRLQEVRHKRNNKLTNTAFYCTNCQYKYDKIKNKYTPPRYKIEES